MTKRSNENGTRRRVASRVGVINKSSICYSLPPFYCFLCHPRTSSMDSLARLALLGCDAIASLPSLNFATDCSSETHATTLFFLLIIILRPASVSFRFSTLAIHADPFPFPGEGHSTKRATKETESASSSSARYSGPFLFAELGQQPGLRSCCKRKASSASPSPSFVALSRETSGLCARAVRPRTLVQSGRSRTIRCN